MSKQSFWDSLAVYCENLAPVVGPLVSTVGETANAVSRAQRGETPRLRRVDLTALPPEDGDPDEDPPD